MSLPLFGRRGWFILGVLVLAGGIYGLSRSLSTDSYTFVGTKIDGAPQVEGIELLRAGSDSVTLPTAWQGEVLLVFFGYTNCPDICPLTMAQLAQVYRDLGEPQGVQVVMVTVDPERDTPERVAQYAESFHPDFVGLSGTADAVNQAERAFFVSHNQIGAEVAHNSHVTLLDRNGQMRLVYTQDKVSALTEDLRYILRRKPW